MPRAKKPKEEAKDELQVSTGANPVEYVSPTNDFPFVYANNAVMAISELDGSITFGEVVGKNPATQKAIVIPKVRVIMATPFLVKLLDLMTTQVENQAKLKRKTTPRSPSPR